MGRYKGKMKKRIMAIVLSVAMTMSNMTVFASETAPEASAETAAELSAEEYAADSSSEEIEQAGSEAGAEDAAVTSSGQEESAQDTDPEKKTEESATGQESTEQPSEEESATVTETTAEASTEEGTTSEKEAVEGTTAGETETATEEETTEETTEEETTEEETTEEETTEEETETEIIEVEEGREQSGYVLDATKDLTAFAEKTKADGDSETAGTDKYFTLLYSAKTKVDSSSKSFDDGYKGTQRVNFGGTASTSMNAVKFTTSAAASVKIYWAEGGDDKRQMVILNADGTEAVSTNEDLAKNAACISTLELQNAGTYYLGSKIGNNYIFQVVVTEEQAAKEVVNELDATKDLTAFAEKTKADGDSETAGTDKYFTLLYSAKTKVDSSSKSFDDGYKGTQRVNFGGTASTSMNAVKFTTSAAASVKIYWAEGGDDKRQMVILNADGTEAASTNEDLAKNAACISTLELQSAGTYYLGSKIGNNYIFRVIVTESGGSVKPPRAEWASVTAPAITSVALNPEDKGKVDVTVNALVGYDGGDKLTVTMLNAQGETVGTGSSSAEKSEHTVSISPKDSGDYTFAATLVRANEEDKPGSPSAPFTFSLPLGKVSIKSATSLGGGRVEIEWEPVKEAEKYVVSVKDTEIAPIETDKTSAVVEGLAVRDEKYTFGVYAVRGEDQGEEAAIEAKATQEAQQKWAFSAYGSSVSSSKDGYEGDAVDGSVRVYSTGNGGKLVPNSTDGLAFYYTEVDPNTTNFTLSATARVNTWTYSNGQEGFGLMAADRVGPNGDGAAFWNNSYMAMVSKVEYFWDGEKVSDAGDKISMKLGVGSIEKKGVTQAGLDELAAGATIPSTFTTLTETLESSCASLGTGTYNLVGNATNSPEGTIANPYTEFKLTIQKNNTGYFVSYLDPATGKTATNKYYDTAALSQLKGDSVYVGFFASRNADVIFTDIHFTAINVEDDAPPEEKPITSVTPNYQVLSGSVSNSEDYDLVFNSNWDGELIIRNGLNAVVAREKVKGDINTDATVNTKVKIPVKLNLGVNEFTLTFTPDKNFAPDDYTRLSSYETITQKHSVTYRRYGTAGQALYVSPDGKASGVGTKENPLDIYTAVKYVQAGQTIVLTAGTYHLTKTVKTERGINGSAEQPIRMVAESGSRPVFDFGGRCAGMILAGDYWYFKGFDVTRSANGQKGIQVSGSSNTLDQINTYKNGNTGIQISRYQGTDLTQAEWPSNNLILNCTSYLNADPGYEDADGFAAKLTIGPGNVFDGCISHHNADDGWDLFAKAETGPIGKVVIQNCVAYRNGYVLRLDNDGDGIGEGDLDLNGVEVNAGNGNGFKMGGESITGYHTLKNSLSFFNKAKGIDSNSCPDIQVYNSVTFNNESYNVAFYTNNAKNTDFYAENLISYRTEYKDVAEQLKPAGTQADEKINNESSYYWKVDLQKSVNSKGAEVSDDWFETLNFTGIDRNPNGTIDTHGFLKLTDKAAPGASGGIGGTESQEPAIGEETGGEVDKGDDADKDEVDVLPDDLPDDGVIPDGLWIASIPDQTYTGSAIKPEVHVYMGSKLLTQGSEYSISIKNNINAAQADKVPTVTITGKGSYEGSVTRNFAIQPLSLADDSVYVDDITVATDGTKDQSSVTPVVSFNGKKLKLGKDFTIEERNTTAREDGSIPFKSFGTWEMTVTGMGNYAGSTVVKVNIADKNDPNTVLMSKVSVGKIANQVYDGREHTPEITNVKAGSAQIPKEAYTVSYRNHTEIGTAVVTIAGNGLVDGKTYVGTKTVTFKITGAGLNRNSVTVSGVEESVVYKGQAVTFPNVKVTLNAKQGVNEEKVLKAGVDYTLSYKNNKKAGNASIVVKGINHYTGTFTQTFRINAYNIETGENHDSVVGGSNKLVDENGVSTISVLYTKGGVKPNMQLLINGRRQVQGTDYTVSYKNNAKVGSAADGTKAPTAVITGKNGLTGKLEVKFTIEQKAFGNPESGITVAADDKVYSKTDKPGSYYVSKVTVRDENGQVIPASEYSVEYYLNQKDEAHKIANMSKETIKTMMSFDKNDKYLGDTVIAEVTGKNVNYTGSIDKEYRIVTTANIKSAKVAAINPKFYGYDTKLYTSDFNIAVDEETGLATESKVTYAGMPLTCGVDFVIDNTTFVNTGKVGTASVTIRGIGNYGGEKVIKYKIEKMRWGVEKAVVLPVYVQFTESAAIDGAALDAETLKGKVLLNNVELVLGKDYEIMIDPRTQKPSYVNNTKLGKASVTIKGIGSYGGQKKISFMVVEPNDIAYADVVQLGRKVVAKEALSAKVELTKEDFTYMDGKGNTFSRIKLWGKDLEFDKDFVIKSYSNNNKAGKAAVTIEGKDSYKGTLKLTFLIEVQEEN